MACAFSGLSEVGITQEVPQVLCYPSGVGAPVGKMASPDQGQKLLLNVVAELFIVQGFSAVRTITYPIYKPCAFGHQLGFLREDITTLDSAAVMINE